ncbi:hypothetical protein BDR03DRAFT_1018317 [Suillus americanus]|nr:hypothetical protein BDR03DRAFT_1018317 [Suillus americanus]
MKLQNSLVKFIEGNSASSIVDTLASSTDITSLFPHHTEFYSIVYGRRVGIFLEKTTALMQVNGLQICKFHKFNTLLDALKYMILKGGPVRDVESQHNLPQRTRHVSTPPRHRIVPQDAVLQQLSSAFEEQLHVHISSDSAPRSVSSSPSTALPLPIILHHRTRSNAGTISQSPSMAALPVILRHNTRSNAGAVSICPSPSTTSSSPSVILHHNRSLAGITGTVLVGEETEDMDPDTPPVGVLGVAAEKYLNSHGYQASAVWSIIHAYREGYCSQDFTDFICARGMPLLEAEYLFELISGRSVYLVDDT